MSQHNVIVVQSSPMGHFGEGIMDADAGAFKPGICVSIKGDEDFVDGRPVYEPWNGGSDGVGPRRVVVVIENHFVGMNADGTGPNGMTGYAAGDRFLFYEPLNGDELNMLFANQTGTAASEAPTAGDDLIIDDGTGKLMKTAGTPDREPFTVMEKLTTPITADTLCLCKYNGA